MSLPVEADFALIKIGDGAPTEAFTVICGIQNVTLNDATATNDRYVRDCAKPGQIPFRKPKATGRSLSVTGAGLINVPNIPQFLAANGAIKNFKIELYRDDGSDTGALLGTYAGAFMLTASNIAVPRDGAGSAEVTLANSGQWTFTVAP